MSTCQSCGGIIGRDCFDTQTCAAITADMMSRGVGSEIHLDADEWGEILYCLKQARYRSEAGHRAFLSGIVSKLEAAGIQSS